MKSKKLKIIIYLCFIFSMFNLIAYTIEETDMFNQNLLDNSIESGFVFLFVYIPVIILNFILFILYCCNFNDKLKFVIIISILIIFSPFFSLYILKGNGLFYTTIGIFIILIYFLIVLLFIFQFINKLNRIKNKTKNITLILLLFVTIGFSIALFNCIDF